MRALPLALVALGLYAVFCLGVALFQRRLIYLPERFPEAQALARAEGLGLQPWRDARGRLVGWRSLRPARGPRVLIFHGNAGSALDRAYYQEALLGCDVRLFEYPGYGARPGSPERRALVAAALEALEVLGRESRDAPWLLGESLGSGVACELAARRPGALSGVLLVTPFLRMSDVAARHYPLLPVRLLLRERWDNGVALKDYRGRLGLLIAGRDEVVGAEQGRLLAASQAPRARVWEQPRAGHNSWDANAHAVPWPEVRTFLGVPEGTGLRREGPAAPAR